MAHARIEEIDDSDVEMSDPSEDDIEDFEDTDILRRVSPAGAGSSSAQAPPGAKSHLIDPANIPSAASSSSSAGLRAPQVTLETDASKYAHYQCLYPVYFDATRTRAQGRRVGKELAVANPLATDLAGACSSLRIPSVLEMGKTHPKDWANPGRVKILLKAQGGAAGARGGQRAAHDVVKNKHHLYVLVAEYLRAHPTTEASPSLRMRLHGVPQPPALQDPSKPWPRPAVPRGWKVGELLPFASPALTGGGVSENLFKDMMKEMQGGGDPMAALQNAAGKAMAGGGGGQAAIEDKKGKKGKGKGKA